MNTTLRRVLTGRRRGVALIVVLAMATLLTAVAISLVSATRVDRLAGANYLDSVVARRLVPQAVDAALRAALPQFDAATPAATPALRLFPNNGVFVVNGSGATIGAWDAATLTNDVTLAYFCSNHVSTVKAQASSAKWSNLTDSSGKVVGRYVAIIENQSGLADLNALTGVAYHQAGPSGGIVSNVVPRVPYRVSPAQMDATPLLAKESSPALSEIQVYDKLAKNSSSLLGRFESRPDIRTYATAGGPANETERFTWYSRAPLFAPTYRDALISTNKWINASRVKAAPVTATDATILAGFQDLTAGSTDLATPHNFPGMPVSNTRARIAADALIDYVDADHIPSNLWFSNERAFMWNEIKFGIDNIASTDLGSGNFSHTITVVLQSELFYPYTTSNTAANITNDAKLTMEYTIDINGTQVVGSTTIDNNLNGLVGKPVMTTAERLPAIPQVTKTHTVNTTGGPRTSVTVKPKITLATVTLGGQTVDVIDPVATSNISLGSGENKGYLHLEAFDPRANRTLDGTFGDIASVKPWRQSVRKDAAGIALFTLGAINDYTKVTLETRKDGFYDATTGASVSVTDLEQFVSNSEMGIASELGYLPHSAWRSFKLYATATQAAHPVLDYFYSTNCFTRVPPSGFIAGQINPNTADRDVLSLPFAGLTLDRFPGEPGSVAITSADALNTFAAAIYKGAPKYPFLNVSDAYDVPALGAALLALPINELRRESVVRNSHMLMTTRNNVLQVLLLVQAVKLDGSVQVPVATEKVLATVWRDPVTRISDPAAAGERFNRYFVRSITALND